MNTEKSIEILSTVLVYTHIDTDYGYDNIDGSVKLVPGKDIADALDLAISALRAQQEAENPKQLTLDELRTMRGEPVWCAEYECWGIVKMETAGNWANKPSLVGVWHNHNYGTAINFDHDIEYRGLTIYRHKPKEA